MSILQIRNLKTYFFLKRGAVKAVDGVSFDLQKGETLCIVGESGCGKSVLTLSILRLIQSPPGRIVSGQVIFDGTDLLSNSVEDMRKIRGKEIGMIFQDPRTSLNPVLTVGFQIFESLRLHLLLSKNNAWRRSVEMLKLVGIPAPEKRVHEYPHELSGGMRQRAMIAMALSCNPKVLIADEPTTALDVTIQAQVLDLMKKTKENFMPSILFITHDLGIVAGIADRVMIMYAGKIVETAPVKNLFKNPLHPYTQGLLESVPRIGRAQERQKHKRPLLEIPGIVPDLINLPKGCAFAPRCTKAISICHEEAPETKGVDDRHSVSCWLFD